MGYNELIDKSSSDLIKIQAQLIVTRENLVLRLEDFLKDDTVLFFFSNIATFLGTNFYFALSIDQETIIHAITTYRMARNLLLLSRIEMRTGFHEIQFYPYWDAMLDLFFSEQERQLMRVVVFAFDNGVLTVAQIKGIDETLSLIDFILNKREQVIKKDPFA